jgi:hypothetical protein
MLGRRSQVVAERVAARSVVRLEGVPGPCDDALPLGPAHPVRPVFSGEGPLQYVCASCFRVLCDGIAPGDLGGLLVRCGCGQTNRVPE